jgi:4-hydroxy-3-methylbut-2-en-1-yl diphosphate reductase
MAEIIIAEFAGTCKGVKQAIEKSFNFAKKNQDKNVFIKGDIVHNPIIVNELNKLGVKKIDTINNLKKSDNLIIRAHGDKKEIFDYCKKNKINVIDCTCPLVKNSITLGLSLEKDNYQVIIIGDKDHPEVKGIKSQLKHPIIVSGKDEININELKKYNKIGVLSQTTQKLKIFNDSIEVIQSLVNEVKIHNTICNATSIRQKAAIKLSLDVNLMIIIGGKKSANTKALYELCNNLIKSHWINDTCEIKKDWFTTINKVGITAGASTPIKLINEIKNHINNINK